MQGPDFQRLRAADMLALSRRPRGCDGVTQTQQFPHMGVVAVARPRHPAGNLASRRDIRYPARRETKEDAWQSK